MKQTKTKLLCLLIAALMLLSLAACGKETTKDSNLIKLGDYELLYKGACIMEDSLCAQGRCCQGRGDL